PVAMTAVSDFYARGIGVERNEQLAYWWAQEAKNTGDASGFAALQRCYAAGVGVPRDQNRAAALKREALERSRQSPMGNPRFVQLVMNEIPLPVMAGPSGPWIANSLAIASYFHRQGDSFKSGTKKLKADLRDLKETIDRCERNGA